ncbi:MAG: cysteine--tRNA ligase [Deltaproteobacteria bacterium]|jgi:cysteinyl-tRNA synthetase|nr:cysteine--tRNA ligase [Deltaproteobacteria bacterium]
MHIYNTISGKKEEFIPVRTGKASIYVCGITAYDYCHVGHARSAIVFDVLVRYLRSLDMEVTFVRNFTDVDDKIINRSIQEGISCSELVSRYIQAFYDDMDQLGVMRADIEPKATEHVKEMLDICRTLIQKQHAYATPSGNVYFRVHSFSSYGKLAGRSLDEMLAGARVTPDEEKEDPLDFALWKAAKPGEPFWESPWGKGRPGWHIECSAMSEKYLPLPLDIHGGGQDLIFPHHENEIAQSEAALDKQFCRYWVHNGFVEINSEKMSKSLNNFKTIREILSSYPPEVLRFFLLTRHYRTPIDFSLGAMEDAEKNLKRLYQGLEAMEIALSKTNWQPGKPDQSQMEEVQKSAQGWKDSMEDDLNTAAAMGYINNLMHQINRVLENKSLNKNEAGRTVLRQSLDLLRRWGDVLGILRRPPAEFLRELKVIGLKRKEIDSDKVEALLEKRREARKAGDFACSDAIRDELFGMGVELRDTPQGTLWDLS